MFFLERRAVQTTHIIQPFSNCTVLNFKSSTESVLLLSLYVETASLHVASERAVCIVLSNSAKIMLKLAYTAYGGLIVVENCTATELQPVRA